MSDDDSEDEMYSVTSSQTVYKRTRSRTSSIEARETDYRPPPKIRVDSGSFGRRTSDEYHPVQKWAVDYNNKNYVRSLCNKNKGLHRKIKGRPLDWRVQYDNSYFTRSKIDPPKGLHRRIPEIKRKYAPDQDDLADAKGWEFDWGPEIDQVEQDVVYIPEGRIINRGCYRWYGVKRNDSDCDIKQQEDRENLLNEEFERQLKCGQEFLQADVPHMTEQKERKYSRGGYRHYEVQRNAYDIKPEELAEVDDDPEWRRKHHSNGFRSLDLGMCKYDRVDLSDFYTTKGKPFRRTILNKVYELRKEHDPRESSARHGTRLSLVPGEGEKTVYEGVPDRYRFKAKEAPSIRSVFKKKSERQKYRSSREGSEFEEYEKDTEQTYREELRPEHEERLHRMAATKREQRRSSYEDVERESKSGSGRSDEYTYRVKSENFDTPRRQSGTKSRRSLEDIRDNFETWRDKATDRRGEQIQHNYSANESRGKTYNEYDNLPRDEVFQKRRNTETDFDHDDRRSQRSKSSKSSRDYGHADSITHSSRTMKDNDVHFKDIGPEKDNVSKKLPPHVEERMRKIREKMNRKIAHADHKHKEKGDNKISSMSESDDIDLTKHKEHPKDRGQAHNSEYEKYVSKNGSEFWIKKEEKYSELHHQDY